MCQSGVKNALRGVSWRPNWWKRCPLIHHLDRIFILANTKFEYSTHLFHPYHLVFQFPILRKWVQRLAWFVLRLPSQHLIPFNFTGKVRHIIPYTTWIYHYLLTIIDWHLSTLLQWLIWLVRPLGARLLVAGQEGVASSMPMGLVPQMHLHFLLIRHIKLYLTVSVLVVLRLLIETFAQVLF